MAKQTYAEKLKDPRWQKKRLGIMQREEFKCQWCGTGERTLNIHHGYYQRGIDPWEYPDDTLYCLCDPCHENAGCLLADLHKQIARIHPKYLSSLFVEFYEIWNLAYGGKLKEEKMEIY